VPHVSYYTPNYITLKEKEPKRITHTHATKIDTLKGKRVSMVLHQTLHTTLPCMHFFLCKRRKREVGNVALTTHQLTQTPCTPWKKHQCKELPNGCGKLKRRGLVATRLDWEPWTLGKLHPPKKPYSRAN